LRVLARKVGISGPFLSDIELGRRFPSEEILVKLASALNVPLEDLKQHDNREPIADLKRLMDSDLERSIAVIAGAQGARPYRRTLVLAASLITGVESGQLMVSLHHE
jgi:transcriptional regulator with XRE-family HTH domain